MPTTYNMIGHFPEDFPVFCQEYYKSRPERLRRPVEEGRSPSVLLISRFNSRTTPFEPFYIGLGDMFTMWCIGASAKTPGTFCGTYTAISYAINHLGVEHVIGK